MANIRARELGIAPGILPTGTWNAITDVAGVKVGHVTLIEGEDIRTGVTAILPHGGNMFQEKVPAGIVVGNGFGKLMGSTQVEELGELETPIILTNTLAVPAAAEAVIDWTLSQAGNEDVRSVNPVVGETNDGWLNDIRKRAVTKASALAALEIAESGPLLKDASARARGQSALGGKAASARVHASCQNPWAVTRWERWSNPTLAASCKWMACPSAKNWDNII